MSQPLVSVVIPCYNQAHYLREAVDSVLNQTYSPVEAIVVNDGSPDNTADVAGSYGDRIRYIEVPNGGPSAARNSGIAVARGRYLKFLDSDDFLHPEQIARQMEAIGDRENAVAFTAVRLFRDGQPEANLDHIPTAKALLPDLFKDIDWGSILCYLFPRKLVEAVGGFANGQAEDWFFACQIGMHDPVFLPDPRIGCYYRQCAGSRSADRDDVLRWQARWLMTLHDQLRQSGRADWFGPDLLKYEQGIYESMVRRQLPERDLREALLVRFQELQQRLGLFGRYGWRFRMLARVLGYSRAERLRGAVVRLLRKRPPETLDTGVWRELAKPER